MHAREGDAGDAEVIYTAFPNTGTDTKSTTFRLRAAIPWHGAEERKSVEQRIKQR